MAGWTITPAVLEGLAKNGIEGEELDAFIEKYEEKSA